jgi:hypothetical protein
MASIYFVPGHVETGQRRVFKLRMHEQTNINGVRCENELTTLCECLYNRPNLQLSPSCKLPSPSCKLPSSCDVVYMYINSCKLVIHWAPESSSS